MPSLSKRSYEKELLDSDDIPFPDIAVNMRELDRINTVLGGHAITLRGLQTLIGKSVPAKRLSVLEIGCGGGDNLRAIGNWARRKGLILDLCGLDYNAACISFAQDRPGNEGIRFLHCDYRALPDSEKPDIIFSSLFCHHFTDAELVTQLEWMRQRSRIGFFINDLHRHQLAYHSIRFLSRLFSRSYLVKNDAPLSVRRGFTHREWKALFTKANIADYTCSWRWAFRWLITVPQS